MQLIRLVERVGPLYPALDMDILVFGAAFHDFGKIWELSYPHAVGYTDEGRLVGHISTSVIWVDRKIREIQNFPESLGWQLKHLILSHHGKLEFGSPKVPVTLEAEMIHILDLLDSRLEGIESLMRSERNNSRWTSVHKAFGTAYYKPSHYLCGERKDS